MVGVSSGVQVPHFKLPLRIGLDGHAEVLEQDTPEEIAQCVQVLLSTRVGDRIESPEYGIPDQVFTTVPDLATIQAAIERWEPRATVKLVSEQDWLDELIRRLIVEVQ